MRSIEALKAYGVVIGCVFLIGLLIRAKILAFSRGPKSERIEATAFGAGLQAGQVVGITLEIYEYSTQEDRRILVEAFSKAKNQGLFNALCKMKAVGRCSITGTLGCDVSYICSTPTPAGRKLVFVTNRQVRFGEAFWDSQAQSDNLMTGDFELNETDKSKSRGVVYPAAQLAIDREGQLQFVSQEGSLRLADIHEFEKSA
jgi:hypothetical protein